MKKREEDFVKLQIEKRQLEEDLENVLMKNQVLLKMSQQIKSENSRICEQLNDSQRDKENLLAELEATKQEMVTLETNRRDSENYEIETLQNENDEKDIAIEEMG
jgi:nucleoside-triphosphatase THEP1